MPHHPHFVRFRPAPTIVTHVLGEFLGTFLLILRISLCGQQEDAVGNFAPIAIGFVLCSLVFSFGYLGSAVFNPSVSLSLWILELMTMKKVIIYTITHVILGLAAAFLGWFLWGSGSDLGAPAPMSDSGLDIFRAMIAEFIFTFGRMAVVFHVACSRQRDNQHYGLGIGVFVTAAAYSCGGISGAALNPVVATSLQIVLCVAHDCRPVKYIWLYWVFPTLGAVAAAFMFACMHPVDVDSDCEDDDDDNEEGEDDDDDLSSKHGSSVSSGGRTAIVNAHALDDADGLPFLNKRACIGAEGEEEEEEDTTVANLDENGQPIEKCTLGADGNMLCQIPGGGYLLHENNNDSGCETDVNYHLGNRNPQRHHHHQSHHHQPTKPKPKPKHPHKHQPHHHHNHQHAAVGAPEELQQFHHKFDRDGYCLSIATRNMNMMTTTSMSHHATTTAVVATLSSTFATTNPTPTPIRIESIRLKAMAVVAASLFRRSV